MPGRRRCRRWVDTLPQADYFMPNIPYNGVTTIRIEEFEAFRLVDYLGLTQHEAAARMGISQKALWNDLKNARFNIADAIINGKAIRIEGGTYALRR
ncbi:MAG: DNA-binding protein [Thermoplasmata archaeon]|nr:MAG: DNA-binding protein [Thermoplasmata archaeon]RLF54966.1 MAG: DNA-binding protein [Thermoplasmata archaeon]HDN50358.1 DUF134 domain-containing protein [Thermoplasmatales archaeon]